MFGSAAGEPYWHQATASSPSKTSAACPLPSRTRRSFQGRPFSPSGLPTREWNQVHQQPPNPMPLCFSARRAKASHVEASSDLIAYSLIAPPVTDVPNDDSTHILLGVDERPFDASQPGYCRDCSRALACASVRERTSRCRLVLNE